MITSESCMLYAHSITEQYQMTLSNACAMLFYHCVFVVTRVAVGKVPSLEVINLVLYES